KETTPIVPHPIEKYSTPGHIEQLKARPDVEIVGAYDHDEQRGLQLSSRYGIKFYTRLEALLAEGLDLAVIDSENSMHGEHVKAAAERGINVFCEKPIGSDLRMALEIRSIVRRHGILFTTGFNSRFNPEILKLRELVQSGELGRVCMARVRVAHSAAIDRWFSGWSAWFASRELAGGGGFLDLGIHGADLLRFVLGEEAVEVQGLTGNATGAYSIDDQGVGVIRFSGGALGILDAGWTQLVEHMPWSPLEVYGSRGSALRTWIGLMYYTREKGWVKPVPPQPPARNALDDIIDAVKTGRNPFITVEDAVKAQEIIEAVYISGREGRSVKLPLLS
ncbi:MAG: Gfo/Idh/MocA family oxidoreductase, partial [Thermofilaceae archaeon]